MLKTNKIYKSSNKVVGEIRLYKNHIEVDNLEKPPIIYVYDKDILACFDSKVFDRNIGLKLYDEYNLCINEIAALFGLFYNHIFHKLRYEQKKTGKHQGRRNSSYGKKFSKNRRDNIKKSLICLRHINNGKKESAIRAGDKLPDGWKFGRLPFSDEHKYKISQAAKDGKYLSSSEIAKRGWQNGKFKNVNFKRGIGGYITSKKIQKRFFFRSLLELYYIIYYLEENEVVNTYSYEPFYIKMENGSSYTPDFIVNENTLIELKPYNFIYKQGGTIQSNFEYKNEQAKKYCKNNNLTFKIVFDKDIQFDYMRLKHDLIEQHKLDDYCIEFLQPERFFKDNK